MLYYNQYHSSISIYLYLSLQSMPPYARVTMAVFIHLKVLFTVHAQNQLPLATKLNPNPPVPCLCWVSGCEARLPSTNKLTVLAWAKAGINASDGFSLLPIFGRWIVLHHDCYEQSVKQEQESYRRQQS